MDCGAEERTQGPTTEIAYDDDWDAIDGRLSKLLGLMQNETQGCIVQVDVGQHRVDEYTLEKPDQLADCWRVPYDIMDEERSAVVYSYTRSGALIRRLIIQVGRPRGSPTPLVGVSYAGQRRNPEGALVWRKVNKLASKKEDDEVKVTIWIDCCGGEGTRRVATLFTRELSLIERPLVRIASEGIAQGTASKADKEAKSPVKGRALKMWRSTNHVSCYYEPSLRDRTERGAPSMSNVFKRETHSATDGSLLRTEYWDELHDGLSRETRLPGGVQDIRTTLYYLDGDTDGTAAWYESTGCRGLAHGQSPDQVYNASEEERPGRLDEWLAKGLEDRESKAEEARAAQGECHFRVTGALRTLWYAAQRADPDLADLIKKPGNSFRVNEEDGLLEKYVTEKNVGDRWVPVVPEGAAGVRCPAGGTPLAQPRSAHSDASGRPPEGGRGEPAARKDGARAVPRRAGAATCARAARGRGHGLVTYATAASTAVLTWPR